MKLSIVDSHQHFWKVGAFDYPWMKAEAEVLYRDYLPSDLEPVMLECGISKTVLVQASNSLAETRWLLTLADANPFIAGVVGWIDLASPEVNRQLNEFAPHPKFKGVRHLVESEPTEDWLVRPSVLRGLQTLSTYDLSFDLLVHTRHLKYVDSVATACPDLRLVIDHMAKPPIASGEIDEWAREIAEVARIQTIHCKLSGLITEANHATWQTKDLQPYLDVALECFGDRRLMFGSDYPVCLLAGSYNRVRASAQSLTEQLSEESRRRIFAENAIGFYKLSPAPQPVS